MAHDLRTHDIRAQVDFSGRKLGKVMSYANQIAAKFVAVVGDNELETEQVELKDMDTGETRVTPLSHLATRIKDYYV